MFLIFIKYLIENSFSTPLPYRLKKRLAEKNPDRVDIFMKGAQSRVKWMLENFKDLEFYTGESMNPEGMAIAVNYREDGMTPYLVINKLTLCYQYLILFDLVLLQGWSRRRKVLSGNGGNSENIMKTLLLRFSAPRELL